MRTPSLAVSAVLLGLGSAGCITLDTKQCKVRADCERLAAKGETYVCSAGLCQHEECTDDSFCRDKAQTLGDNFKYSVCQPDPELGDVKACLPAECTASEECTSMAGMSPTAECAQGKCVDHWACLGQPDDRETGGSVTVDYQVKVVDSSTLKMPPSLEVKVCGIANDTDCTTGPNATVTIDHSTGVVTLAGLPQDAPIHLQLRADDDGLFPTEFYSQRPARGVKTVEPTEANMIPRSLVVFLAGASGVATDAENNATVLARFLDCEEELGADLTISSSNTLPNTRAFYIKKGNLTDARVTKSDSYGAAGIVNVPGGKQTTIDVRLHGKTEVASMPIVPKAGWMTAIVFYPRDYAR